MRFNASNAATDQNRSEFGTGDGSGRLFAAAAILARKGRYAEATKLLQKALDAGECSDAEAFDLQARIYAQQGLYLHAESCWRRAKHLDESNPAYDEALNRLRQARHSVGRFFHMAAAVPVLVILGLLLWQAALVNPDVRNRQGAAETSLVAIRADVAASQSAAQSREHKLAASVAGLGDDLHALDARLSEQLTALPTTSKTAEDRDAVIARVDERITALQRDVARQVGDLSARHAEANAAQVKRIENIETTVAQLHKTVNALEGGLGNRVAEVEVGLIKHLDTVESAIRRDMKPLSTSADWAVVNQSISKLREQLAEVAVAVQELKKAAADRSGDASGEETVGQPPTQPEGQQP